MSSLAAQLASIASLDSSRLKAAKQSATAPSYLFTPTEAAQHDLETIHSLGINGLEELRQLDPSLDVFEDDVFGEAAKQADRLLLPLSENQRLGATLDVFLGRLSRHIPLRAAAKVIEWLVRRFRCVRCLADSPGSGRFRIGADLSSDLAQRARNERRRRPRLLPALSRLAAVCAHPQHPPDPVRPPCFTSSEKRCPDLS